MKEYKISVPVNCMNMDSMGREKILKKLKDFDAKRVFLNFEETVDSGHIYLFDEDRHREQMEKLHFATEFFKSNGYEVAAWFWAFKADKKLGFTDLRDFDGKEISPFACPTDKRFVDFSTHCIEDVARCGVDMIVFNDDFRYGFFSSAPACLCENHIKLICERVNENLSISQLKDKIIYGSENKYREAYLKVNKESLLNFASTMRKSVDRVNPSVRMGFCAVMSSWDMDGDAFELAKALAGSTYPFIRLIGAPYWAVEKSWNNRLQDVVELNRMEKTFLGNKEVELIAEGDVWPRPRISCPASFLEGYDTALRATQILDGILKIGIDYTAQPEYENGYSLFHLRNKPLYKKIEEAFCDKKATGIRVYEYAKKIEKMKNPNELGEEYNIENLFFSEAARTLACNGIPTVYEGEGCCGIVFGENARSIPRDTLKNGMILDAAAAAILYNRGIDVGVKRFGEEMEVRSEEFLNGQNRVIAINSIAYDIKLKENAKILSVGITEKGEIPMSFIYENAGKERFLVININPRKNANLMRHYARGRQYCDFAGGSFDAVCTGNPDVYLLCSKGNGELAVGVWNFCIDPILKPVVELGQTYKNIRFINGGGKLLGKKAELEEIPGYSFMGFVVS